MKKLLTILLLFCTLNLSAQNDKYKFDKKEIASTGIFMTLGGVALTFGAVVTPGELMRNNGRWVPMPIYNQDARFAGVVVGSALTLTGALTAIFTSKKSKKHGATKRR